jgi:LysM repeat protein
VLSAPTPAIPAPGAPVAVDTAAPLTAAPIAELQPDADTATSAPIASPPSAAPEAPVTEPVEPPATTATVTPQAESLTDARCGAEYEIVAGDFWIRIADGAGVEIADLFAVNDATSDTPLFPGRTICLPVGASTPTSPPPTAPTAPPTAPPTNTSAPSTASSSGSSGTTSTASTPRTTPAPTTTVAPPALPPASNATADEVQAIIRAVWPDDLEERALEIARRESKYLATAKNNCCYGVFQIYWSVHRSWLGGLGVTSPEQLYDPTINARAALTLYERAGGWGPWGG